jgi:pimeloyl-ACP methyl ester carboxylesterase
MTEHVSTAVLDLGYEVDGPPDGPVAVMVHGWPDDVCCWDGVVPALTERGYRVLRPHLRGHGATSFRSPDTPRSGQSGALGTDLRDFLDALDLSEVLLVGHDWGARAGYVVGALFPDRLRALVAMSAGYGASGPDAPLPYRLAHAYWYEWFVATERGRAVVRQDRRAFSRYLWDSWSPGWQYRADEFERAAGAWDNPDWPEVTVTAYLHRWGEHPGDPAYTDVEGQLAKTPPVRVPTLVIHGADDGDNLASTSEGKEDLFADRYERVVLDDVGHFVPRESPRRTANEILRWVS